jgi:hypothetical protein
LQLFVLGFGGFPVRGHRNGPWNSKGRFSSKSNREQQDLLLRMLVGGFGVLVGILTMFESRRSVYFRLVMLTNIVMMCRFNVMMGGCVMMSGSSVMMLASRVFLLRHAELS